jgi:hypothetical protein
MRKIVLKLWAVRGNGPARFRGYIASVSLLCIERCNFGYAYVFARDLLELFLDGALKV